MIAESLLKIGRWKTMAKNVSEFTRLRDIARKRNIRLVEQGLTSPINFPRVRDIRNDPVRYQKELERLRNYVGQGATVKAVKQSGTGFYNPEFGLPPFGVQKPKEKSKRQLTEAQRARKNARARQRYAEQKVFEYGGAEKGKRYKGYLKSLQTVIKEWQKVGYNPGFDIENLILKPDQARAFVEYMDYRFTQSDFNNKYVTHEFIEDFGKIIQKGKQPSQILNDFKAFMKDREGLKSRSRRMRGMSASEALNLWDKFVGR